ncbi:MAG TPA: rRNA maturation RNase YbeY [Clostridia bacterium]|nr:rRNA maturation RNase YbeY [Clostridia bacterium]
MSVFIDNRQEAVAVGEALEAMTGRIVEKVLASEDCEEAYEVSISFVNNEEIRSLNREYRGIDKATDVLSFPMLEFTEEEQEEDEEGVEYIDEEIALGDIVISMEKASEQAEEYGHSFDRELAFLLVHGMLHLLGYDHEVEATEGEIFDRQEEILRELNFTK